MFWRVCCRIAGVALDSLTSITDAVHASEATKWIHQVREVAGETLALYRIQSPQGSVVKSSGIVNSKAASQSCDTTQI